MCEVYRGNLQEQLNGGSARLWVIKGQGRWLRSNEVDLHGFLGIQFKRLTLFDMPMKRRETRTCLDEASKSPECSWVAVSFSWMSIHS